MYDQLAIKANAIDSSELVKKADQDIKIKEIEDKILNHDKYTGCPSKKYIQIKIFMLKK